MSFSLARASGLLLAALLIGSVATAQIDEPSATRALLDGIRDDLVGLEFEKALAALEALLAQPELDEAERVEALVLRSQAHVAFGDLGAAENDYREILVARPDFEPDETLTPRKALERYRKARTGTIGDLFIEVQPPDAQILIDGRPVELVADGKLPLVAGEHLVAAEHEGFDSRQQSVTVEANQDARVELRLVPNARTVVLFTEPEGVDIALDGVWVGRTTRQEDPTPGSARQPARLVLPNLLLGEHVFELSLACHRSERIRDLLTVDLLDWSPRSYPPFHMVPVRATVLLREAPEGAGLLVDGDHVATLPAGPIEVCPGERELEVSYGGRVIWRQTASLAEADEGIFRVEPRPNLLLLGADRWPAELDAARERFNTIVAPLLVPPRDPAKLAGWTRIVFPDNVDLVVLPREQAAGEAGSSWWLYSPLLNIVEPFSNARELLQRPRWSRVAWGLQLVDSRRKGPALVAQVVPGGAAAVAGLSPGDRLTSLGGTQVTTTRQAESIMTAASAGAPLDVEWLSPDGKARRGPLSGASTVRLDETTTGAVDAAVRAAWATLDAITDSSASASATANLALLLSVHGLHRQAVRAWRRVEFPEREGIAAGTIRYYLGRDLQRIGADREAEAALRAAAASAATAVDDEGPLVAPAARDRLADLGVR